MGRFGQGSWPTDPAPASFIDEVGAGMGAEGELGTAFLLERGSGVV